MSRLHRFFLGGVVATMLALPVVGSAQSTMIGPAAGQRVETRRVAGQSQLNDARMARSGAAVSHRAGPRHLNYYGHAYPRQGYHSHPGRFKPAYSQYFYPYGYSTYRIPYYYQYYNINQGW